MFGEESRKSEKLPAQYVLDALITKKFFSISAAVFFDRASSSGYSANLSLV
jgi:hypothetical protein